MHACSGRQRLAGFTLLEVLISISIFAVVVSSVYAAYQATFATVNTTERQVAYATAARVILERLSEDLESLSLEQDSYLRGKRGDVDGMRADSLACIAFAHQVFRRSARSGGRAVLQYSLQQTESGLMDLYRSDIPVAPPGGGAAGQVLAGEADAGELLGRGLQEFRITYVSADGQEYEEWDSSRENNLAGAGGTETMVLPALIRLEVRFADSAESESGTLFRTAVALPVAPATGTEGG